MSRKQYSGKNKTTLAETNLFDIIKNDRIKHRYVANCLKRFSEVMNKISNTDMDKKLKIELFRLSYNEEVLNLKNSLKLSCDERNHLKNSLKTRYLIKSRSL